MRSLKQQRIMEVVCCFEIGGSERLAALLATRLSDSGVSVSVCATHTKEGPISEQLIAAGVPCFAMDRESRSRIGIRLALYQLFRQQRIDILHVHHVPMFMLCYLPARFAGIRKIVLTEHTDYELRIVPRLNMAARKYARKADLITVIHKGLREFFVGDLGMPREKVILIQNGVDTNEFSPRKKDVKFRRSLGVEGDDILLGWVGRIHPDKDLNMLMLAIAELVQQVTVNIRLAIVGNGPQRRDLETVVAKLGLTNVVHFLGSRSDIPFLLNNFDIFLLSSRTEGMPMVILEAMSSGLPCVATSVGGIADVIDGQNSVLVTPGDYNGFAKQVRALIEAPERREQMGAMARQSILDHHGIEKMVTEYRNVLFSG